MSSNPFTSATATPAMQLIAPDVVVDQQKLARQQQMADLLKQQALQQTGTEMVGGWAVQKSPFEHLAKLGQALMASKMQEDIDAGNKALSGKYMTRLSELLNGTGAAPKDGGTGLTIDAKPAGMSDTTSSPVENADGTTSYSMPRQNNPSMSTPTADSNPFAIGNLLRGQAIETVGGNGAANTYWDQFKKTELAKNLTLLPENMRGPAVQQHFLPPIVARAGAPIMVMGTDGKLKVDPASIDAIGQVKTAQAPYEPMRTIKAEDGSEVQLTEPEYLQWQKDHKLPLRLAPSAVTSNAQVEANTTGKPQDINIARPGVGTITGQVQPRLGVSQTPQARESATSSAKNEQDEFSKSWQALQTANSEAQNTNSYLQSIKELASKAKAGKFSNQWEFANNVLSMLGFEKATDEVSAKNLLDKYSNQIIARLGGGAMGTDAARSILQAAYPSSKMSPDAINEAVDNLVGANEMTKAKMRHLQPHGISRNAKAFTEASIAFDQAADPRVWQLKGMSPEAQKAFVAKMDPAVAKDLLERIQKLKKMGAY